MFIFYYCHLPIFKSCGHQQLHTYAHFISFAFSENIDFHFLPLQTKSAQDLVTWESLGGNTNIIKMEDDDDEDLSDHETTSQNVGFSR